MYIYIYIKMNIYTYIFIYKMNIYIYIQKYIYRTKNLNSRRLPLNYTVLRYQVMLIKR